MQFSGLWFCVYFSTLYKWNHVFSTFIVHIAFGGLTLYDLFMLYCTYSLFIFDLVWYFIISTYYAFFIHLLLMNFGFLFSFACNECWFLSFCSALLRCKWHITLHKCRCTLWIWSTYMLWNDYHGSIFNTFITSRNYHFFFVVRSCQIYSLTNFQAFNTVLLTILMLYLRFPEFIHLITGSLYHLPPFCPPPQTCNHHSTLFLWAQQFLDST